MTAKELALILLNADSNMLNNELDMTVDINKYGTHINLIDKRTDTYIWKVTIKNKHRSLFDIHKGA